MADYCRGFFRDHGLYCLGSLAGSQMDRSHKGVNLHQFLVKIEFLNARNQKDTAAFKVPYPPQWINAIENNLLKEQSGSKVQG